MPYTNAQATPRADIFALVQQANADFNKLFIGDLILPPKIEDARRGVYMKANLANAELLNADALPREGGAGYNRVNRRFDTDTYDCQEYGLESIVDDSYEAEVERFMNLEATEAMLLERSLKISYEARVAAAIFNTTTFGAGATPAASYTAANLATIDVPLDIDTAKTLLLKKGIIPNAIVMNQDVFNRIRRTTFLQNQVSFLGMLDNGCFPLSRTLQMFSEWRICSWQKLPTTPPTKRPPTVVRSSSLLPTSS